MGEVAAKPTEGAPRARGQHELVAGNIQTCTTIAQHND